LKRSVNSLLVHGHKLDEIQNYALDQFVYFLDETRRSDAQARLAFTIDLAAVVGGVLGGGDTLSAHIDALTDDVNGD